MAKYITFSFDDAVTQDEKLIKLLDKYNLKATFNLNSGLLGTENYLNYNGKILSHIKVNKEIVNNLYKNHEVACHTVNHFFLPDISENEVFEQVENDRIALESLVGYSIIGMAYPCGGENFNEAVKKIIREKTPIKFARTIKNTYNFKSPTDFYNWNPTVHINDEILFDLADRFINDETDGIFFIWGHAYEFDIDGKWERFEKFCKKISNIANIKYLTNTQLYKEILKENNKKRTS